MDRDAFRSKYGSWALIAGASEGLGAAWARRLAELGLNVHLVARREQLLEQTAQELRRSFPQVQVETQALDLGCDDLLGKLAPLDERDFGLVVYNAAYAIIQPFLAHDAEQLEGYVDVNCRAPLLLAHHFGERFRQRGRGGIILMSSMVGFSGASMFGPYAATKSFLLTLGEALYHELGPKGVDALVCVAGATRTPGYLGSEPHYAWWFKPSESEPQSVVDETLEQLGRKPVHVAGTWNRVTLFMLQRVLGRNLATRLINDTLKRTYSHHNGGAR